MRAVVLDAVDRPLRLTPDHPEPSVSQRPDGDGLVLTISACGVCHSDLHVVDGVYPSPLPLILGHEITGVDEQLGPVMVYAPWGCGSCRQCHDGLENICANSNEAGLLTDGGYAERMFVPDRRYLAPLGGLDPIQAAPLACGGLTAYRAVNHAVEHLRARDGARALVIGAGGLGQFAIRFLALLTAATVVALDISGDKRTTALAIGAHQATGDWSEISGVDAVFDFIGAQTALDVAARVVNRQGMIVAVGLGGGGVPVGFGTIPHEAKVMTSVWGSRRQLDELLDLARREPSVLPLIESLPLSQAQLAHDRLRAGNVEGRLVLVP